MNKLYIVVLMSCLFCVSCNNDNSTEINKHAQSTKKIVKDNNKSGREIILVQNYLINRDYDALNKHIEDLINNYKNGRVSDEFIYNALNDFVKSTNDSQEVFFDEWVKKYPKSYSALVARGYYLSNKAWGIRGNKYARDTTSEQMDGFALYSEKSKKDLKDSIRYDDKPILSYIKLMNIDGSAGHHHDSEELFKTALEIDSNSIEARIIYMYYSQPKWGGSVEQMDEALSESVESKLSDDQKNRMRQMYYFYLAQEYERLDMSTKALDMYWKSYEYGQHKNKYYPLKVGVDLAQKIRNYDQALKFLDKIIETHDEYEVWALGKRAYIYETQLNDHKKAYADLINAVEKGSVYAENALGVMYYYGLYPERDVNKAIEYWESAAAKGNKDAKDNLEKYK